jgi:uncharacterized protein YaaN involved in tellurite resistance
MAKLPLQFADLEKYAGKWAKPTFHQRYDVRLSSSMDEINDFYQTMLPKIDSIVEYLNQYPVGQMPEDAKTLFYLICATMNIAPAVELYHQPNVWLGFEPGRLEMVDRKSAV